MCIYTHPLHDTHTHTSGNMYYIDMYVYTHVYRAEAFTEHGQRHAPGATDSAGRFFPDLAWGKPGNLSRFIGFIY